MENGRLWHHCSSHLVAREICQKPNDPSEDFRHVGVLCVCAYVRVCLCVLSGE